MLQLKKIALYIRISSEDINKLEREESNSIQNQRILLRNYVNKNAEFHGKEILEFIDDGYSGTNFERPAFQDMMKAIRNNEIECIIIKDFSRFGRNYIEVGTYMEQVLPFLRVRLIALNENYDSNDNKGVSAGIEVALKNLIYDLYSKDCSDKTKDILNLKKEQGMFLAGTFPYGYQLSKEDKHKLVIDEEAGIIVKLIFKMSYEGVPKAEIIRKLNREKIDIPSVYLQKKFQKTNWTLKYEKQLWNHNMILRILKNQIYIGNMVSCRQGSISPGSKKKYNKKKEEWIVAENTHEAIIEKEVFEAVNKTLRTDCNIQYKDRENRPLSGKVFCGCCKHPMRWIERKRKPSYYWCSYQQFDYSYHCLKEHAEERHLEEITLKTIQMLSVLAEDIDQVIKKKKNTLSRKQEKRMKQLKEYENARKKLSNFRLDAFEQYSLEQLTQESYLQIKITYDMQMEEIERKITDITWEIEESNKEWCRENDFAENFSQYSQVEHLSREVVEELIESIYYYGNGRIEIKYKFQDTYEEVVRFFQRYGESKTL